METKTKRPVGRPPKPKQLSAMELFQQRESVDLYRCNFCENVILRIEPSTLFMARCYQCNKSDFTKIKWKYRQTNFLGKVDEENGYWVDE